MDGSRGETQGWRSGSFQCLLGKMKTLSDVEDDGGSERLTHVLQGSHQVGPDLTKVRIFSQKFVGSPRPAGVDVDGI